MRYDTTQHAMTATTAGIDASRAAIETSACTWFVVDVTARLDHAKARGPGGTS